MSERFRHENLYVEGRSCKKEGNPEDGRHPSSANFLVITTDLFSF